MDITDIFANPHLYDTQEVWVDKDTGLLYINQNDSHSRWYAGYLIVPRTVRVEPKEGDDE